MFEPSCNIIQTGTSMKTSMSINGSSFVSNFHNINKRIVIIKINNQLLTNHNTNNNNRNSNNNNNNNTNNNNNNN